MSDDPKIIYPFDPARAPGRNELAHNAARWAALAKRELELQGLGRKVGFIFAFFQRGQTGQGTGVLASNVSEEALRDEVRAIARRWSDQQRIVVPDGEG